MLYLQQNTTYGWIYPLFSAVYEDMSGRKNICLCSVTPIKLTRNSTIGWIYHDLQPDRLSHWILKHRVQDNHGLYFGFGVRLDDIGKTAKKQDWILIWVVF